MLLLVEPSVLMVLCIERRWLLHSFSIELGVLPLGVRTVVWPGLHPPGTPKYLTKQRACVAGVVGCGCRNGVSEAWECGGRLPAPLQGDPRALSLQTGVPDTFGSLVSAKLSNAAVGTAAAAGV